MVRSRIIPMLNTQPMRCADRLGMNGSWSRSTLGMPHIGACHLYLIVEHAYLSRTSAAMLQEFATGAAGLRL